MSTAGSGHGVVGDVRTQQPDAVTVRVGQQLFERDRNAVKLLAGGAGRAPDPDTGRPGAGAAVNQVGDDLMPEQIEGRSVPEEKSLIRGNSVDNAPFQPVAAIGPGPRQQSGI